MAWPISISIAICGGIAALFVLVADVDPLTAYLATRVFPTVIESTMRAHIVIQGGVTPALDDIVS